MCYGDYQGKTKFGMKKKLNLKWQIAVFGANKMYSV
jgi:hypothetical protein